MVLHNITVPLVQDGEVVGLIGPNGSGKSTLLKAAAGLIPPAAGMVRLNGNPLGDRMALARQLAYLPQDPVCHWPLPVERVVELGLLPFSLSDAEQRERVERAMKAADVARFGGRTMDELSGGERARVFLARALVGDPVLLLVDEPGAGLDAYYQLQLMELLRQRAAAGKGVLVVLHDLTLAARFCDRMLLLHEGRLVASGLPETVLSGETLARVYGVTVHQGSHEGQAFVLPWRRCR